MACVGDRGCRRVWKRGAQYVPIRLYMVSFFEHGWRGGRGSWHEDAGFRAAIYMCDSEGCVYLVSIEDFQVEEDRLSKT